MPWPLSATAISAWPPSRSVMSMRVAPASIAFSTSSLTAAAGRSMTSPAAMRLTGADREAIPQRLGHRHHIGWNPGPFMGEQFAGAAHAALHLVIDQEQPELVADVAQPPQVIGRGRPHAAFALHRLDQDRRGLVGDRGTHLVQIVEGDMVEPVHRGPEP